MRKGIDIQRKFENCDSLSFSKVERACRYAGMIWYIRTHFKQLISDALSMLAQNALQSGGAADFCGAHLQDGQNLMRYRGAARVSYSESKSSEGLN